MSRAGLFPPNQAMERGLGDQHPAGEVAWKKRGPHALRQ